jgi:hypothetical protein
VNWLTFFEPFSPTLWCALGVLQLSNICFLTLTFYLGREQHLNPASFLPGNSCLAIWGSWLNQGCWIDPKSLPSRILILLSFCCGVIFYTAYSAKLIASLSVTKVAMPFTTLEELLKSKDYSVGSIKGTAMLNIFPGAPTGSLYQRVAQELMKEADVVDDIDAGVARIHSHKYAFVWVDYVMPNEGGCEFLEIPIILDSKINAFAWNPRLELSPLLDHYLRRMRESGQLQRVLTKWLPRTGADCGAGATFRSMGTENIVTAFVLLAGTMLLASIIFIGELLANLYATNLQQN